MNQAIAQAIDVAGSQGKLADLSGLSQQHISRLLRDEQRITADTAIKIEAATGYRVTRGQLCPQFWPPALETSPSHMRADARPAPRARAAR